MAQGPLEVAEGWHRSPAVTKSNDAHSGSFAAQVESGDFVNPQTGDTLSIPGRLITGSGGGMVPPIDGFSISYHPDSLVGWFKYFPVANDSAIFRVTLSKWNAFSESRELIGQGLYSSQGSLDYARFSMPIQYSSADLADTCTIEFFSSNPFSGVQGSVLLVDDVELIASLNVVNVVDNPFLIYPNPVRDILILQGGDQENQIEISNALGQKCTSKVLVDVKGIDVSNLTPGMYFLSVSNKEKITIKAFLKE